MQRGSSRFLALLAVVGALVGFTVTSRPQAGAAQSPDILPSLLAEVRGLRAAMEQMAAAGPRVQLALGRLQLQEQRINALVRRLESVRDQRVSAERDVEARQFQAKIVGAGETPDSPAEREMSEQMQAMAKAELARLAADIQRLTLEESDLSAQIASEQARWTAINQQVEELERSLGRR